MSEKQIEHRFKIGQTVKCNPTMFERRVPSETFTVTRLLPIEGSRILYRIKSIAGEQERVVDETQLT